MLVKQPAKEVVWRWLAYSFQPISDNPQNDCHMIVVPQKDWAESSELTKLIDIGVKLRWITALRNLRSDVTAFNSCQKFIQFGYGETLRNMFSFRVWFLVFDEVLFIQKDGKEISFCYCALPFHCPFSELSVSLQWPVKTKPSCFRKAHLSKIHNFPLNFRNTCR